MARPASGIRDNGSIHGGADGAGPRIGGAGGRGDRVATLLSDDADRDEARPSASESARRAIRRRGSAGQLDGPAVVAAGLLLVGAVLCFWNRMGDASRTRYYVYDGLGSNVLEFDQAGNMRNAALYYAYGTMVKPVPSSGLGVKPTYAGGLNIDGTTKFGARLYDSATGRFTQYDPSGQEAHPYAYARCNPVNSTDPTGLDAEDSEATLDVATHLAEGGIALASVAAGLATTGVGVGVGAGLILVGVGEMVAADLIRPSCDDYEEDEEE